VRAEEKVCRACTVRVRLYTSPITRDRRLPIKKKKKGEKNEAFVKFTPVNSVDPAAPPSLYAAIASDP
jgi:hypothetical protein